MRASLLRNTTIGVLAMVGTMVGLTACGGGGVPPVIVTHTNPVPPAPPTTAAPAPATATGRTYTDEWLQTQLVDTKNSDGTSTTNATCVDLVVDANGVGSYECVMEYSDNTHGSGEVDVPANGQWRTAV